jgi:YHS domain-containing protein
MNVDSTESSASGLAIDPVSRKDVSTTGALTSFYGGRIYYFATPENRQLFEASPQQYAREEFGRPLAAAPSESEPRESETRRRRRGGC